MKGYWNNGGSLGYQVIAGLFKSESKAYSLFATSNSFFRVKPPYMGTAFEAIDFLNPNIEWNGDAFSFDWVPGAYNVGTSLTVGETCKFNTPLGLYPVDPNAAGAYTAVVPAFYVRVSGNGGTGEALPDMNKLDKFAGTWKKNRCYAAMGSGVRANVKPLDLSGNVVYNDSTPPVTVEATEESAILQPDPAKRYKYVSAVWKVEPIATSGLNNIYGGWNLPLFKTLASGQETTTVSRWATVQTGAPTTGGVITIGWRLMFVPFAIQEYYQKKLGTKYPYL